MKSAVSSLQLKKKTKFKAKKTFLLDKTNRKLEVSEFAVEMISTHKCPSLFKINSFQLGELTTHKVFDCSPVVKKV